MDPRIDEWFRRRTTTSHDWDAGELADAKGSTTVSVVLPARNEARTVGSIVGRLRRRLVHDVPLIDEILVLDSGSTDETAAVARAAGARVVRQDEALPHVVDQPGKGEALWKGVHVTDGDIVAFIDADIVDFDPQFAVGLLGPLLTDPSISFVKAFYDRPLQTGERVLPAGGGRVTEILARPLLNLHWPTLAGIVQPLAGEYAGRRALLERTPFVSGYGVDIALLIDVVELEGLDAVAQVDLGRRCHRNSSDAVLGRMAAQVYLAVLSRLERYGAGVLTVAPHTTLTQFTRCGDSFVPQSHEVGIIERPPLEELAEHRRDDWHGLGMGG
jgi:glucosyl-3-phosphoglycerate synthase